MFLIVGTVSTVTDCPSGPGHLSRNWRTAHLLPPHADPRFFDECLQSSGWTPTGMRLAHERLDCDPLVARRPKELRDLPMRR